MLTHQDRQHEPEGIGEIMRILLNLAEWPHLKRLKDWASISRTLNAAKQLIERLDGEMCGECYDDDSATVIEQCGHTLSELGAIEPMLDSLHQLTRSQVWAKEKAEEDFKNIETRVMIEAASDLMLAHLLQRAIEIAKINDEGSLNNVLIELDKRIKKRKQENNNVI